jgi:hypothetical protein
MTAGLPRKKWLRLLGKTGVHPLQRSRYNFHQDFAVP